MNEIKLIPVEDKYLSQILDIYNYYVENSIATYACDKVELNEIRKMVYYDDKRFGAFVILDGEDVVGYCILGQFNKKKGYSGTGEITIYLKDGCTGRGIGKIAVEFLENKALERHFHVLLAHVTVTNEPSVKLFDKLGYQKIGPLKEVGNKFGQVLSDYYFHKML